MKKELRKPNPEKLEKLIRERKEQMEKKPSEEFFEAIEKTEAYNQRVMDIIASQSTKRKSNY